MLFKFLECSRHYAKCYKYKVDLNKAVAFWRSHTSSMGDMYQSKYNPKGLMLIQINTKWWGNTEKKIFFSGWVKEDSTQLG